MPRPASRVPLALLAVSLVAGGVACAGASSGHGVVAAPVEAPADAGAPLDAGAAADDSVAPARFRACATEEDCVAVPRVGCCHDGTNEAVAVTEREAYLASFVCPVAQPICPLVIVRDTRTPRCDASTHLCTLVAK